jgi:hypothetical protein
MADKFNPADKRHETRYPILSEHSCEVQIQRRGKDSDEALEGELIDLSQGGAKLLVSTCLQFSEVIRLIVRIPTLALEIDVTADVRWTRPEGNTSWLVGCSFNPGISEELLHKLAVHSLVERRRSPRYAVTAQVIMSRQSSDQRHTVRLKDISTGGFCLTCEQPVPLGSKVLIELPTRHGVEMEITANVRWHMSADDVHLIGCAFNSSKDYQALRDSIRDDSEQLTPDSPRPFLTWTLAACGMLMICVLSVMGYFREKSSLRPTASHNADSVAVGTINTANTDDLVDESLDPWRAIDAFSLPVAEYTAPAPIPAEAFAPAAQADAIAADETEVPLPDIADLMNDVPSLDDTMTIHVSNSVNNTTSTMPTRQLGQGDQVAVPTATDEEAVADGVMSAASVNETDLDAAPATQEAAPSSTPEIEHSPPKRQAIPAQVAEGTRPVHEDLLQARRAFIRGDRDYRAGRYSDALSSFQEAVRHDADNPLYHYLLALVQYRSGQVADAQLTLDTAIALERQHPIANWGQTLMRYQGEARIWLERRRAK